MVSWEETRGVCGFYEVGPARVMMRFMLLWE